VLSILPAYCKQTLNANEHLVTLFLALFSLGVGIGSIFAKSSVSIIWSWALRR
jgi:hypothetical protein